MKMGTSEYNKNYLMILFFQNMHHRVFMSNVGINKRLDALK